VKKLPTGLAIIASLIISATSFAGIESRVLPSGGKAPQSALEWMPPTEPGEFRFEGDPDALLSEGEERLGRQENFEAAIRSGNFGQVLDRIDELATMEVGAADRAEAMARDAALFEIVALLSEHHDPALIPILLRIAEIAPLVEYEDLVRARGGVFQPWWNFPSYAQQSANRIHYSWSREVIRELAAKGELGFDSIESEIKPILFGAVEGVFDLDDQDEKRAWLTWLFDYFDESSREMDEDLRAKVEDETGDPLLARFIAAGPFAREEHTYWPSLWFGVEGQTFEAFLNLMKAMELASIDTERAAGFSRPEHAQSELFHQLMQERIEAGSQNYTFAYVRHAPDDAAEWATKQLENAGIDQAYERRLFMIVLSLSGTSEMARNTVERLAAGEIPASPSTWRAAKERLGK